MNDAAPSGGVPEGVAQVLAALPSAAVVLAADGTVALASPAAASYGLVNAGRLRHAELVALVDRSRLRGKTEVGELRLARGPLGGPELQLRVRVAALGDGLMLLLADDHSEAERVDAVRRDFLANISHELKTPVGAIGLLTEAIESAADDPARVRRFAAQLAEEASRLAHLTHDVIELTRAQSTDALSGARLVKVRKVLDEALDRNRLAAQSAGVEIVRRQDGSPQVLGQHGQLVSAVHNLILNAIQHSPAGSRVVVSVRVVDGVVEISVTDEGEGIEPHELERIFERFYRVDEARSRHAGGSGIGLAIVKHSVQSHGGDVRAWSRPGEGSTFTIRLAEAGGRGRDTSSISLPVDAAAGPGGSAA